MLKCQNLMGGKDDTLSEKRRINFFDDLLLILLKNP